MYQTGAYSGFSLGGGKSLRSHAKRGYYIRAKREKFFRFCPPLGQFCPPPQNHNSWLTAELNKLHLLVSMLNALEFSLQSLLNGRTDRAGIFRDASLDQKEVLLEILAVQPKYSSENFRALSMDTRKRGSLSSNRDKHFGWSYIQNCWIHHKT